MTLCAELCVGGAPVSDMLADEFGADGYGADASDAIELFKELCRATRNT